MLCRPLTPLDAENLSYLHNHVVHPWEKPWSKEAFEDLLHQPSIHGLSFWDEPYDGRSLKSFILYQECDVIDILYLATHPTMQKRGFASSLMQHIIAKRIPITLDVCEQNENALRLYKKLGFQILHVRKNYYNTQDHNYNAITFYLN